jgi:NAD(P)-dependent dehydrogenase (short-subunit alcohol dehydrogenase family)
VNTISTILLATLLLPHLKAQRSRRSSPAHLTLVGSGRFADPNILNWASWHDEGILTHLSKPENWPGGNAMYGVTMLLLQYGFRELSELAKGPDGRLVAPSLYTEFWQGFADRKTMDCRPEVIMNTVCPGAVKTDLSRGFRENGVALKVAVKVYHTMFAKSSENGARAYVAAVTTREEEHGKMVQFYMSDAQLAA